MKYIPFLLCAAVLAGCQSTNTITTPINQEQEQAVHSGKVAALYDRLNSICPSSALSFESYPDLIASADRLYIGGPFEEYYLHGKKQITATDSKTLAKGLARNFDKNLFTACSAIDQEAAEIYRMREAAAEEMRKAVMGE